MVPDYITLAAGVIGKRERAGSLFLPRMATFEECLCSE
jgi:hypothetical protein